MAPINLSITHSLHAYHLLSVGYITSYVLIFQKSTYAVIKIHVRPTDLT